MLSPHAAKAGISSRSRVRAFAPVRACLRVPVHVHACIGSAHRMPPRNVAILRHSHEALLCQLKMVSPIPDVPIAAYYRDGKWEFQPMQIALVRVYASPCGEAATRRNRKPKRAPLPKCPSSTSLQVALEALRASKLDGIKTLQIERNCELRLRSIPVLASCCVADGERFGQLEHFHLLVERTSVPNIVVYFCAEKQFVVISAKRSLTQPVNTRSAICWLRAGAGLGFLFDEERGVFRIEASRNFLNDDEDPWSEGLARLLSSLSVVFPACTFSDES